MITKLPLVTVDVQKRLWAIIVIVGLGLLYITIGGLFGRNGSGLGFRTYAPPILAFGFVVILFIALSGLAASQRLVSMAINDGLTGLYNQSFIRVRLSEEISRADRYGTAFSLILADIDDFKSINDHHGHVAGDRVLRSFAEHLRRILRASDIVGRFGGDEFLILLPQTSLADAARTAERIRKATSESSRGTPLRPDRGALTLSFGVCGTDTERVPADEILARADKAMTRAKKEGKNRVVALGKDDAGEASGP
jgi:two-component system cell cycle response regulator